MHTKTHTYIYINFKFVWVEVAGNSSEIFSSEVLSVPASQMGRRQ